MSADIGSVLAEQRAVVTLLMKRCQATDQPTPAGVESFLQALFGHMTVLERVVLPALGRSKHAGGVAAALRISAAHLAKTLAEQRVDSHLCDSIPLLFVAETLLLRDAPH